MAYWIARDTFPLEHLVLWRILRLPTASSFYDLSKAILVFPVVSLTTVGQGKLAKRPMALRALCISNAMCEYVEYEKIRRSWRRLLKDLLVFAGLEETRCKPSVVTRCRLHSLVSWWKEVFACYISDGIKRTSRLTATKILLQLSRFQMSVISKKLQWWSTRSLFWKVLNSACKDTKMTSGKRGRYTRRRVRALILMPHLDVKIAPHLKCQ